MSSIGIFVFGILGVELAIIVGVFCWYGIECLKMGAEHRRFMKELEESRRARGRNGRQ